MKRTSTGLAIAMAGALVACGSKSTSTVASALDFCTASTSAITDGIARCESWSPAAAQMVKGRATDACQATQKDVADHRASYDSAKGTACVNAMKAITDCAKLRQIDGSSADALGKLLPDCSGVVQPTVKVGGSCYGDGACEAGWCDESSGACPGTCKASATEGQDCGQIPCAPGMSCWNAYDPGTGITTQTCKRPAAAGQDCSSNHCDVGLDCDGSSSVPTCVAERGLGESCATVRCTLGLYCDQTTSQCAAPRTGGPCSGSRECAVGYRCVYSGATQSSACAKITGLDAACVAGEYTCGMGYYCDPSTLKCAKTPAVGEACDTGDRYCLDGYCDAATSKCAAWKPVGAACDQTMDECGSLAYCDFTMHTCKANDSCTAP